MTSREHEALLQQLQDGNKLKIYKEAYDGLPTGFFPRFFARILFGSMDLVYGKKPHLAKFKVLEVIARVPYQSWEFVNYLITTHFYMNEHKAIECALRGDEGKFAQDNETMHVVVISQICKQEKVGNWVMHTLAPVLVSYVYFMISTLLYFFDRRHSYQLNYLFENHAYNEYEKFIREHSETLKQKPARCAFLDFYGRECANQLELFESIKNDEIIHRNESAVEMCDDCNNPLLEDLFEPKETEKNTD